MDFHLITQIFLIGFLLVAPTIAVFRRNTKGAAVLTVVAVSALLLTRLPDVSAFELFGMKAKLDRQTQEVEITVQQLRRLAAALGEASLNQIAMSGQMLTRITTAGKFVMRDNIINSLQNIGVPDDEILKVQGLWIHIYCTMIRQL
ncbi:MAG: hypothetical protein ACLQME_02510 [Alphaproteobacteria bacterium]